MDWSLFFLAALAGAAAGMASVLALVRFRGLVRRLSQEEGELELPLLGKLETHWDFQPDGLYLYEALEFQEKIRRLGRLVDFEWLLNYARKYRVSYVGFKANRAGHSWNPGCLACSSLESHPQGGYRIYLNPDLDVERTSVHLAQELGLDLRPEEVQYFLFLHEIGHTAEAGNTCLISAAISSALSGGRRTHRRRKEITRLRAQVERYADHFAVQELLKLRTARKISGPGAGASAEKEISSL